MRRNVDGTMEKRLVKVFQMLAVSLFFLLFYYGLGMTGVHKELSNEMIFFQSDSIIENILGMGIFVFAVERVLHFGKRFTCGQSHMDKRALVVSAMIVLFCCYWIHASNTAPQADQKAICDYAAAFNHGDYSGLQKGGYVGVYQQQLGLITWMRIILLLGGDYKTFQYLSAIMAGCMIFFGYQVVKILSENIRVQCCYLMLAVCCVPMYVYTAFVYGEIISSALLMLAAWILLICLKRFSWRMAIAFGIIVGLSVQFRKNALIMAAGFLIVIVGKTFAKDRIKKMHMLALACILILGMVLTNGLVKDGIYKGKIPGDSKPMPALLHVAMGCNRDGQNPGWYNGYNWNTYHDFACDGQAAGQEAIRTIRKFLDDCASDHAFAVDFFVRKIAAQWEAPMYQCLAMNNCFAGEQSRFAQQVYFGSLRIWIERFMNIYQLIIYGGIFVLLIQKWKDFERIEYFVLLIGVFGGFLFSLIWEAKTRYIFPYLLFMMPYAAMGLEGILKWIAAAHAKERPALGKRKQIRG